jgi:hypothetical protein
MTRKLLLLLVATMLLMSNTAVSAPLSAASTDPSEYTYACSSTSPSRLDTTLTGPVDIGFACKTGRHPSFRIIRLYPVGEKPTCTFTGAPSVPIEGDILLPTGSLVHFSAQVGSPLNSNFRGDVGTGSTDILYSARSLTWVPDSDYGLIQFGGWKLDMFDCYMRGKTVAYAPELYFYGAILEPARR